MNDDRVLCKHAKNTCCRYAVMDKIFYNKCLKITECNSYENHNIYPRLKKELMSKRLSKYYRFF